MLVRINCIATLHLTLAAGVLAAPCDRPSDDAVSARSCDADDISLLQSKQSNEVGYRTGPLNTSVVPDAGTEHLASVLRQVFASSRNKIPNQLLLTAKPATLDEMDSSVRDNVLNTLQLSDDKDTAKVDDNSDSAVRVRWFGDEACHDFISEHYDQELLGMFENAHPGYYRGDICRAAVLYQEGGFYTDVDVQLAVPITRLVDENTTFMSAYSVNGDIFNGLLGVVPKSDVMGETLQEIRRWYRGESEQVGLMGTMTMLRALENVVAASCGDDSDLLEDHTLQGKQWNCGPHALRLYQERELICDFLNDFEGSAAEQAKTECPEERRESESAGMRYGIFDNRRSLVAWPRFQNCHGDPLENGCGSGGHT